MHNIGIHSAIGCVVYNVNSFSCLVPCFQQTGSKALHYAAGNSHSEIVKLLLRAGATESPIEVSHQFVDGKYSAILVIGSKLPWQKKFSAACLTL